MNQPTPLNPLPTPGQLAWQAREVTLFVHGHVPCIKRQAALFCKS